MKNEEVDSGKRWCCVCAYDGTNYAGWQKQPTNDAVQNKIEDALHNIFSTPIRTIGAGRTDAGVHANGQVFHFDHQVDAWRRIICLQALRAHLPSDICPLSIERGAPFFSCLQFGQRKALSLSCGTGLGYATGGGILPVVEK